LLEDLGHELIKILETDLLLRKTAGRKGIGTFSFFLLFNLVKKQNGIEHDETLLR